jgi:hypothetical protein
LFVILGAKVGIFFEVHKKLLYFLIKPRRKTSICLTKPRGKAKNIMKKPRGIIFIFLLKPRGINIRSSNILTEVSKKVLSEQSIRQVHGIRFLLHHHVGINLRGMDAGMPKEQALANIDHAFGQLRQMKDGELDGVNAEELLNEL